MRESKAEVIKSYLSLVQNGEKSMNCIFYLSITLNISRMQRRLGKTNDLFPFISVCINFDAGNYSYGFVSPRIFIFSPNFAFNLRCLYISHGYLGHAKRKRILQAYAESEGPDQPALPHSLIRAFTVRLQNHWTLQYVWMESKGADCTLRMRRMIWICVFCACSKACFRLTRLSKGVWNRYTQERR